MKALIAGGAGFIGSTVASACIDMGIEPVIVDNLSTGRAEFVQGRIFYPGDIADGELIDRVFAEHPDVFAVVHTAGFTIVPESVGQPLVYYRENVAKSLEFIGHLLRNRCQRYVFSSSASIYASGADFAVDEDSPLAPNSPYANTKTVMETILADCSNAYDLRVLSLRYFNPIGADPEMRTGLQSLAPTHILGKLIEAAAHDKEFRVTGADWPTRDGTGIRDYIHVWDLADAHIRALLKFDQVLPPQGPSGHLAINLGTGRGTTVREFIRAFEHVLGRSIRVREEGRRPGDVAGAFARSRRARDLLGWEPRRTVEDGIRDSMRWWKLRERVLGDPLTSTTINPLS